MAGLGDVVGVPVGVTSLGGHAPVTRGYRHALSWALAIGLHLLLLALFASFSLPTTTSAPSTTSSLDVVLVSRPAVAPEQARAIAEAAQQAASRDTEPETAPEPATQAASAASSPGQASEQVPAPSPADTVDAVPEATESEVASEPEPASEAVSDPEPEPAAPAREPQHEAKASSLSGRELAANATASLREQDFTMSEQPVELADREQQAAREAAEARYVDAWTRRVQDFGNRFYPAPPDLDGQLKVRVVIDHQGKLLQAEVVQSSGHTELDQAALDTIRGAAPYRPFDSGMAGLDRLSISRVWRFGTGNEFGVR